MRALTLRDVAFGGRKLLPTADWWVDARRYAGTGALLDQGPNKLHAKIGAVGVAQIVPVAGGGNALALPGATGNYATLPHAANQNPAGVLSIVARLDSTAWATNANNTVVAKRAASASWQLRTYGVASGRIELVVWVAGSPFGAVSSVAFPFTGTQRGWLKVTRDPATGTVTFYSAPDQVAEPSSWTQFGTTMPSTVGAIDSTTSPPEIGSAVAGAAAPWSGGIYRCIVRDDATTVIDVDFTGQAVSATSFAATVGGTVTVNSAGTDTNDPLFLPYSGEKYLYLPGLTTNYVSTPDSAATSPTTQIDLVMRVALDDWTPAATTMLMSKRDTSGSAGAFAFWVNTSGQLTTQVWTATVGSATPTSTAPVPAADGQTIWVRMTWRASDGRLQYFTAPDQSSVPTAWTQLGTDRTLAVASIDDTADAVRIGAQYTTGGNPLAGRIYYAEVRTAIDGAPGASFNASNVASPYTTVTGGQGETWTISRTSIGRKAALVDRPLFLFGTDDYMEILDNATLNFAAGQDFTVVAAVRTPSASASMRIMGKRNTGAGWVILWHPSLPRPYGYTDDGTTNNNLIQGVNPVMGALVVDVLKRSGSTTSFAIDTNTAATGAGATGAITNALSMFIGRDGTGVGYADMEFLGAAIFRRALSDAEVAQVVAEFTNVGAYTLAA